MNCILPEIKSCSANEIKTYDNLDITKFICTTCPEYSKPLFDTKKCGNECLPHHIVLNNGNCSPCETGYIPDLNQRSCVYVVAPPQTCHSR